MYIRSGFTAPFVLEADEDSLFGSPLVFNISVNPAADSSVVADITGLQSSTVYYYRCRFSGNTDTRKGRFKTFPAPGQKTDFTLVTGSCQETANMDVFDRITEINPLMLLHTGDYTYPSYQLDNSYYTSYATMQHSWRRRYEEYKMKDMLLSVPIDYIHDDDDGFGAAKNFWITPHHTQDSSGTVYNYFDVDTLPIQGRYNHSRAYTEYFPHYPLVDTSKGLFHSYTIGNTEIFFLDTRSSAEPYHKAFIYDSASGQWAFSPDTNHTILGETQMQWLKQGLQNSTADWKILVCGLPFNKRLKMLIYFGIAFQASVFDIGGTQGTGLRLAASFASYWAGHPYDQQELLDFIHINNIEDVIVVSGDTHHNVIDDGLNAGLPELNASGLSVTDLGLAYYINQYSVALGYPVLDSMWNVGGNGLGPSPNFLNAFGKIDVYKGDSLRLCIVDETGASIACHTIVNSMLAGTGPSAPGVFASVFPNPTSGGLTIRMKENFAYSAEDALYIVDAQGRFVKWINRDQPFQQTMSTDLSGYPAGVYYLIFDGLKDKYSAKIILK